MLLWRLQLFRAISWYVLIVVQHVHDPVRGHSGGHDVSGTVHNTIRSALGGLLSLLRECRAYFDRASMRQLRGRCIGGRDLLGRFLGGGRSSDALCLRLLLLLHLLSVLSLVWYGSR